VPASAAKDASLVIRLGSPLETSSCAAEIGPTPHSASRAGATSVRISSSLRSTSTTSWLSRSAPAAEPVQDRGADVGTWAEPRRRPREPLAAELAKALTQRLGSGNDERAQLVEGGRARLDGASTLEQEQAQLFTPSAAARKAEPVAGQQPSRGQRRVDQIALAAAALPATGPLALPDCDARQLEEADQPRPVAAAALDGEGGQAELQRPGE
jgi:hypothetical protein